MGRLCTQLAMILIPIYPRFHGNINTHASLVLLLSMKTFYHFGFIEVLVDMV